MANKYRSQKINTHCRTMDLITTEQMTYREVETKYKNPLNDFGKKHCYFLV